MGEAKRRKGLDPDFGKTKLVDAEAVMKNLVEGGGAEVETAILSMVEMAIASKGIPGITAMFPVSEEKMSLEFTNYEQVRDLGIKKFLSQCSFPQNRAFALWKDFSGHVMFWAMSQEDCEILKGKLISHLEHNSSDS